VVGGVYYKKLYTLSIISLSLSFVVSRIVYRILSGLHVCVCVCRCVTYIMCVHVYVRRVLLLGR
jgi:hypothetical protein